MSSRQGYRNTSTLSLPEGGPDTALVRATKEAARNAIGDTESDPGLERWTARLTQAVSEWRHPKWAPDDNSPLAKEARAAAGVTGEANPDRNLIVWAMLLLQSVYDWRSRSLRPR